MLNNRARAIGIYYKLTIGMKTFNEKIASILCFLALMSVSIVDNVKAQTLITGTGVSYTQDFNTLSTAGAWANPSLGSWYATGPFGTPLTSIVLNDGEASSAELTSFGTDGDRALGLAPSQTHIGEKYNLVWRFKNTTGSSISALVVSWAGEQWRDATTESQSIQLKYLISASDITTYQEGDLSAVSGGVFNSLYNNGDDSKLNGNYSANRSLFTNNIIQSIPNGYEIVLVWSFTEAGVNHQLAIDDISVTAKIPQTITFSPSGTIVKNYGDASFNLGATSTSGLTINYTSSNSSVASVSGSAVQILGPGSTIITAAQVGDAQYLAATSETKVIEVKPKTPTANAASNTTNSSFTANWSIDNGGRNDSTSYVIRYATVKSFSPTLSTTSGVNTRSKSIGSLLPNTIYFYKTYAVNTSVFSSFSQASAITTGTNYVSANAGNWDTGSNWDVGTINNVANSIKIQHAITLSTARDSVTTNTLWITSTGKLTTNQRIHVTNQLIIEVDADGNSGQILNTANINVGHNATIIVRRSFTGGQWAFVGFPFNVSAANVFAAGTTTPLTWGDLRFAGDLVGSGDYMVMEYDGNKRDRTGQVNTSGNGLNWINVPSRTFVAKKGYTICTGVDRVIDFTLRGENKADIFSLLGSSSTLSLNASNSFAGHHSWNLVVSPLLSAFDMALSPSNAPYYLYNGVNYDVALGGDELLVAPFHSFFLQASNSTLSFANSGRRLKSKSVDDDTEVADDIYLKLSNGTKKYDDITRIRFKNGASTNYVIGEDAAKSFGTDPNVSYLYSLTNNVGYAINTLPRSITSVDLQTKYAANGNYQITINNLEKVKNYSAVLLLDKTTSRYTELLDAKEYNFTVNSVSSDLNRFKVILVPNAVSAITSNSENGIRIVSENRKATILGISYTAALQVLDMSGKMIFNGQINDGESVTIPQNGLYLFQITSNNQITQLKSLIQ